MPKKEINLLPREEFEKKPFGHFLIWALTVGRYVVIFTELIVIIAFLSRFKLDRDLSDLYESIREKQAIIEASSSFEQDFRFLQKRLLTIKTFQEEKVSTVPILAEISSLTPFDVILSSLSFDEEGIRITASALSEEGLGSFISNLSLSPKFKEINLSSISKKAEGPEINFSLTAKIVSSQLESRR